MKRSMKKIVDALKSPKSTTADKHPSRYSIANDDRCVACGRLGVPEGELICWICKASCESQKH